MAMPFDQAFPARRSRLVSALPGWGIGALLVFDPKNVRYLTGFTGGEGLLVVGQREATLFVDGRFTTQAREAVAGVKIVECRDRVEALATFLDGQDHDGVGFEAAFLDVASYLRLRDALPDGALRPLSRELSLLRAVKEPDEIAAIRRAARITDRALLRIREMIRPGLRERDLAVELEYALRREGAEALAFPAIVATGPNAAHPHAEPGGGIVTAGAAVLLDWGAVVDGYCADESRTFLVGDVPEELGAVYALVLEAQERAIAAARPGASCRDVDRAARGFLEEKGYGPYFSHGTGHGIGLDVHEDPRFNARSEAVLEAGMVMSVEPGVYLPGKWGVRIEDTVLVTEEGCEVLTKAPKDPAQP